MAQTPDRIEVTVSPTPIRYAGEIPADMRPYIEAPEDNTSPTLSGWDPATLVDEPPVYDSAADAIVYQGEVFIRRSEAEELRAFPQRFIMGAGDTPDMFQQVFEGQAYFQGLLGHSVSTMTTQELANYVKEQVLALLDESHEALAEVSWKPWAKDQFVNHSQLGGELADILCFLTNLALAAGLTSEQFFALWREKATRNIKRQQKAGGYSQVDGKCPTCRRAIDDLKAKGISTGQFGGVDFCDQPECITAYRANCTEKGI